MSESSQKKLFSLPFSFKKSLYREQNEGADENSNKFFEYLLSEKFTNKFKTVWLTMV